MATHYDATQFDAGDTQVKFSDLFEFQRVLGNGSFGVVVAALQKPYMKECAVKVFPTLLGRPSYLIPYRSL